MRLLVRILDEFVPVVPCSLRIIPNNFLQHFDLVMFVIMYNSSNCNTPLVLFP